MSEPTSARVIGHTLDSEGAASAVSDCVTCNEPRNYWMRASGPGHGKCSCGAYSEHLPSRRQRKAWHRQHKGDVLGATGSA